MSRLFLSRNIEDGNGRAGLSAGAQPPAIGRILLHGAGSLPGPAPGPEFVLVGQGALDTKQVVIASDTVFVVYHSWAPFSLAQQSITAAR